jgi:aminoglycoside/choline kinase family phosphotransferase
MLAGDASFRRYERVHASDGSRAVLMDAPPPQENVAPFRDVARLLQSLGLSAPRVLSCDIDHGLLLLEDFGDRTFGKLLAEGAQPEPLYRLATDTLIDLQRAWRERGDPGAGLPLYDDALLIDREANLLLDWYMPAVGLHPDAGQRESYRQAWQEALARVHAHPSTLVLRDFFPDNLMLLEDRGGTAACGLLDFQDAVIGSPLYDLASLLQDARRDVPPEIEEQMLQRYLAAFPELDAQDARVAYTVIAAQRHAKVIGIFTRLARRDGKPGYLAHIPRLWRLFNKALSAPALEPVHAWLDLNLPRTQRVIPPETAE